MFQESDRIRRWAGTLLSERPSDIENMVIEDVYKLINQRQLHQVELDMHSRELDRLPVDDIRRTFRELRVHQLELERQTEELCQAQVELEEARKRYYHLYHFAPVGYFTIDKNAVILDSNLASAGQLGIGRNHLVSRRLTDFIAPEYRDMFHRHCQKVFRNGIRKNCELKMTRHDGTVFHAHLETIAVVDRDGNFSRCRIAVMDVSERKRAEEALARYREELEVMVEKRTRELKDAQERFSGIYNSSKDAIGYADLNGTIVDVNEALCQLTGYSKEELLSGKKFIDITPAEYHKFESKIAERMLRTGKPAEYEKEYLRKDGTRVPVSMTTFVVRGGSGKPIGLAAIVKDITRRKKAEAALRESEERYRALFEQAADSVVLIDAVTGELLDFNDRAYQNLGYTREEFATLRISDIDAIESAEDVTGHVQKITEKGTETFETRHRTKDGEIRNIEVSSRVVRIDGKKFIQSIWHDITERKRMEQALIKAKDELEARVEERTADLLKANRQLRQEITERKLAEEALRESEQRYRSLFETMEEGVVLIAPDGQIVQVNLAAERLLGLKRSEIESRNYTGPEWDILRSDGTPMPAGEMAGPRAMMELRAVRNMEMGVRRPDGSIVWINVSASPIIDASGVLEGVVGTFSDITERRLAEEALRESEEKYRALVERANDGIVIAQENILRFVNSRFAEMLGYQEEELIDTEFTKVVPQKYHDEIIDRYNRRLKGQDVPPFYEAEFLKKNGQKVDIEASAALIRYGGRISLLAVVRDITERKRAEEILKAVSMKSPVGVYIIQDGKFQFVNPQFLKDTGYSEKELLSMSPFDLALPECWDKIRQNAISMLKGRRSRPYEYRAVIKNGDIRWVLESVASIQYRGRQATLGNYMDITERKQAEEALRESQEKLQRIFETVTEGIVVTDLNGVVTEANEAALKLNGVSTRRELLGKNTFIFVAERDRDRALANMQKTIEEGAINGIEYNLTKADGREFPGEISTAVLRDKDADSIGFVGVIRDLTERKQAEALIRDSERRYRLLAENVADIIWTTDMNLNLTYVSTSVEWVLGYRPEELIGQRVAKLLTPFSLRVARQALIEAREEAEIVEGENLRARAFEYEVTRKDGAIIWTETKMRFLRDPYGQNTGLLGVSRDITERKLVEEEMRALSRRLVETQENERRAIGRELHDQIGQSLTVLKLSLEKVRRSPDEERGAILREAQTMLTELMSQVRNLSLELRPTMLDDLGLLPAFLWHFGRYNTQTSIRVNFKHSGLRRDFPPEVGSAAYRIVQEALTNVARHASVNRVAVNAWADSDTLFLEIRDRGVGFDPTKLTIGTSSGLSGMRERVRQLNGRITIESAPGTGTFITAELPISSRPKKE